MRAMFDRIAGVYDVMNSVMTAGLHHRWRERAVDLARVGPGSQALDVATGTGDLAIASACCQVNPGALLRARASIPSLKSEPTTSPPREANSIARSPVPVATSRDRVPGPTRARSTARERQRWCRPAVMTVFMTS